MLSQQVQTQWTEKNRRTLWFVMNKTKSMLKIDVKPTIAQAFYILQTYFRQTPENEIKILSLAAASLAISTKLKEHYLSIQNILQALIRVCASIPTSATRSLINGFEYSSTFYPTDAEVEIVKSAEIELMSALNFQFDIELPFQYLDEWEDEIKEHIPVEKQPSFIQKCQLDVCLILCSESCVDVPAEVAAAAAIDDVFAKELQKDSTFDKKISAKYGNGVYNVALECIHKESALTAQRA
ncbi:hypothetical protein TVAG_110640 [Trichomonas vaginalis G3]|uniref:Cyclin, N-terminal domain containing protein n=1 Tax=Trichomonas vaginalis (strain ATCC PRA-98 / G3) TaxID=412133 RepID=A2DGR5_TRIV3|nr:cyclin-like family [Trichomonas vaginalis G3]EAY20452.1 hypothetical protein TVAG_110640 [Trichomonas vaginalis G3]KAI5490498.1 cyclin-like family [Trichomonas vaginalis G3]|eukprot:XP_001581438.1 hypothetical protein [Trichomonas vaginalis G3]